MLLFGKFFTLLAFLDVVPETGPVELRQGHGMKSMLTLAATNRTLCHHYCLLGLGLTEMEQTTTRTPSVNGLFHRHYRKSTASG